MKVSARPIGNKADNPRIIISAPMIRSDETDAAAKEATSTLILFREQKYRVGPTAKRPNSVGDGYSVMY